MKELFGMLKSDYQFKKIYFGYTLLAMVIVFVAIALPSLLMFTGNIGLLVSGLLLSVVLGIAAALYTSKMLVNKIVGYFFPTVNVTIKEICFKGLAVACIVLILFVVATILAAIIGFINSIILYLILIPVMVVGYYQLIVLAYCIYYVVIDCYVNDKRGFSIVLANFKSSYSSMRKDVSRITIRIIGFSIVFAIIAEIVISIIGGANPLYNMFYANMMFGINTVSIFDIVRFLFGQLVSLVLYVYLAATIEQYAITKYSNIKKFIK